MWGDGRFSCKGERRVNDRFGGAIDGLFFGKTWIFGGARKWETGSVVRGEKNYKTVGRVRRGKKR